MVGLKFVQGEGVGLVQTGQELLEPCLIRQLTVWLGQSLHLSDLHVQVQRESNECSKRDLYMKGGVSLTHVARLVHERGCVTYTCRILNRLI